MNYVYILASLLILTAGGELLVASSAKLARSFKVSSLAIGLTVVAFGTSTPELFVSLIAAWKAQGELAVSNAIGSNIFNILFILGLSSVIYPLSVTKKLIRYDVPFMILVAVVMTFFAWNLKLSRWEGAVLFLTLLGFTFLTFLKSKEKDGILEEIDSSLNVSSTSFLYRAKLSFLCFISLGLLSFGADLFVQSASALARSLGISERVIGLTLVSAGTSLPELVTSVMAVLRKQRDIAVGNVIGSNIFNILGVLGISSLIAPQNIELSKYLFQIDIPVMLFVSFLCFPFFFTGQTLSRKEGSVFLLAYFAYIYALLR